MVTSDDVGTFTMVTNYQREKKRLVYLLLTCNHKCQVSGAKNIYSEGADPSPAVGCNPTIAEHGSQLKLDENS